MMADGRDCERQTLSLLTDLLLVHVSDVTDAALFVGNRLLDAFLSFCRIPNTGM